MCASSPDTKILWCDRPLRRPWVAHRQQDDQNLLLGLMADANWWVRYRATQSLVGMPGVEADDMVQLRRIISDPFARDMLDQVLAERWFEVQGLAA
jgi:hypothetical protein